MKTQTTASGGGTADIDLQRTKFRPHALWWHSLPPLYLAHDETTPVGTVDSLEYDQRGRLHVTATVTHDAAKRCNGFSVGARVLNTKSAMPTAPTTTPW